MENKQLYFGGVPTGPDVKKIMEAYPVEKLQPGVVIYYNDISGIIGAAIDSSRWKTVTNSWRKRLESDYNIIVKPPKNPDNTFMVLSDDQKVEYAVDETRSAVKKSRRSMTICTRVDLSQLSEEEKKRHDFILSRNSAIIASAKIKPNQKTLPEV